MGRVYVPIDNYDITLFYKKCNTGILYMATCGIRGIDMEFVPNQKQGTFGPIK